MTNTKLTQYVMVCLLLLATPFRNVEAQQIDASRMQQDLRIAESILTELMFEGQTRTRFLEQRVSGNYIPGYGVLFEVTPGSMFAEIRIGEVYAAERQGTRPSGTSTGGVVVDRQVQTERTELFRKGARTFLADYADLLSQVPADEIVAVIVKPQPDQFAVLSTASVRAPSGQSSASGSTRERDSQSVSFITSAKRSDIRDFKSGRITAQQFDRSVTTSTINGESSSEYRIFERILGTGVETSGNPTFSLGRNLTSLKDDRLGLIIMGSVRSGSNNFVFQTIEGFPAVSVGPDSLPFSGRIVLGTRNINLESDWDSLRVEIRNANEELAKAREEINRSVVRINRELGGTVEIQRTGAAQRSPEELQEDLNKFESTLKNLLVDYGRTLTSIDSDKKIMLHLTLDRRSGTDLPSGIIFTVPKSVLESFDKRSISKEEALNRIQVTRMN